jgi:hypothetical protein
VSRISYRKQINGPWVLKEDDDINEDGNNGDQEAPAEEDNGINEDGYNENTSNNDGHGPPAEDNGINEDGNQEQHVAAEEYYWWNSDEDDLLISKKGMKYLGGIYILGFHPFNEIMYFFSTFRAATHII